MLVIVTVIALLCLKSCWVPKVRLVVLSVIDALAVVPATSNGMTRGLPGELSVMVTDPVRKPGPCGVKATAASHEAPAARLVPQVLLVRVNSPNVPPSWMLRLASAEPPTLYSVSFCGALVTPIVCVGKNR